MNIHSTNKAWEVKHQSSAGACFLWSVVFVTLTTGMFLFDIRQQEELSLRSPISVKAHFESAYCGRRNDTKVSGFALFVKYNYSASPNGGQPQKYTATDYRGMADLRVCESHLLTASKNYPYQYFFYEADKPHQYRLSIEKRSSVYILMFGLLFAAIPAALGFYQLENQRKKKRAD